MARFMCVQCGAQFAETSEPPPACPVCEYERQFVRWSGQEWTTFEDLRASHRNVFTDEDGLTGIGIEPSFPSTGFGYIQAGDALSVADAPHSYAVRSFVEKPDLDTATAYLAAGGYRWNAGMFVVKASVLLQLYSPPWLWNLQWS